MSRSRLVILLSGAGTLARSVLIAAQEGRLSAEVVAIGSDREQAPGLGLAGEFNTDAFTVSPMDYPQRSDWDSALAQRVAQYSPDWVVSAGFMRILGAETLSRFNDRIVNSHPSLLPAFPGVRAVSDALSYGVKVTGSTIHLVDEGVDTGPILSQTAVTVEPDDSVESLHGRIKVVEREHLVDVLAKLCQGSFRIDGRKATLL